MDEAGEPCGKALVELRGGNDDRRRFGRAEPLSDVDHYVGTREKWTGADGEFRFGELAPGTYELVVLVPKRAAIPGRTIEVAPGEGITDLEVVAPPPGLRPAGPREQATLSVRAAPSAQSSARRR